MTETVDSRRRQREYGESPAFSAARVIAQAELERMEDAERKAKPLASGCLDYFPDALLAVAELSQIGNKRYCPGQPLKWDRTKSPDDADCLARHFLDRGTFDTDGVRHSVKVAWRALAIAQKEIEAAKKEPRQSGVQWSEDRQ